MTTKLKHLSLIFINIFFIVTGYVHAQVMEEWVERYNGPDSSGDNAYSLALGPGGDVYVTGYSINNTYTDVLTIKYNSLGVQQWVQRYNGTGNHIDEGTAITTDASGNIYVAGFSAGVGTAEDFLIIKYNSAGVQQWLRTYNGPSNFNDRGMAITVDASGNVYVTGKSGAQSGDDYATIKYNSSGTQQWVQRFNGPGNMQDVPHSIVVDAFKNVYVTGVSNGGTTNGDFSTFKYDSSGNILWERRYNGPPGFHDEARAMYADNSGNIYVAGYSMGSQSNYDYAIIKYNSAGVQQWVYRYNGTFNSIDDARALIVDQSGNVYVTGYSLSNPNDYDCATVKINSSGIFQWAKIYNGPGSQTDEGNSLALDASGNLYVAGRSTGNLTNLDYAIIKYDPSGNEKWLQRYNGPAGGGDEPTSIAVDASGNVFVTGGSSGVQTSSDFATIKYSQSIGINNISNGIPDDFSLFQNYPNPFNPVTKFKFQIPVSESVNITVFNMLGKRIESLFNGKLQAGLYEAEWDATNYPSGQYFYRIMTEHFIETKKMILIK